MYMICVAFFSFSILLYYSNYVLVYVTVEVRNQKLGHTTENAIFALMCRMALKLAVYQAVELNSSPQRRYGL